MNASPATVARSIRRNAEAAKAVTKDVRTLTYSSSTGDLSWQDRATARCAARGEHIMDTVEADLPGDRTIGHCECGEYMDTGTWDERNA